MARGRKLWSYSEGRRGRRVTIREPRLGAPLRWDYNIEDERYRPEVVPEIRVRPSPREPVDPKVAAQAELLCLEKYGKLHGVREEKPSSQKQTAEGLTVGKAFDLYFDPDRAALPKSASARANHAASRAFWLAAIGTDKRGKARLWNDITPADVRGPLIRLRDAGKAPTAEKRLDNLRTLARWLQRGMAIRGLDDITLGIDAAEVVAGHEPRRPRLTPGQRIALRGILPSMSYRSRMFFTLLISSGTRAVQAREAWRSEIDGPLEPTPAPGVYPSGWVKFGAKKKAKPHVSPLTAGQRATIFELIADHYTAQEAAYMADGKDYRLVPGGALDHPDYQHPASDRHMRDELEIAYERAGVPKKAGDWKGFHAFRRAWADIIRAKEGLEGASVGLGHHSVNTTQIYVGDYDHDRIARNRVHMEAEERGEK